MKTGSLFSGYAGLDMAVNAFFGSETAWFVEYDQAPSKILAHHWPNTPNYGDVTAVDWAAVEPVDILTGGYPCQPFSAAGRRQGTNDERHLWPYVREAIRHLRPRYTVLENVAGHRSLGFDRVLGDMAEDGLHARWVSVRASDVGACHRRERLFILVTPADAGCDGCEGCQECDSNAYRQSFGAPRWDDADGCGDTAADASRYGRDEGRPESAGQFGRPDAAVSGCAPEPDVTLLPTPVAQPSANTPENHLRKKPGREVVTDLAILVENDLLATGGRLLPTPNASDGTGGGQHPERREGHSRQLIDYALAVATDWGAYEPAIRRAEAVTGRPAPSPTEPNRNGNPRLSAAFAEWMMMLPAGHVTDPAIGLSRNEQLKALGNGVVPQQAAYALSLLAGVRV